MRRFFLLGLCALVFLISIPFPAMAQNTKTDVVGIWSGALAPGAIKLRLVLEIGKKGNDYTAVLKSIDQGGPPIPCDTVTLKDKAVHVGVAAINGAFDATLSADGKTLSGKWTQGGNTLPLVMARTDKAPELRRPQEPKPPFPYVTEDLTYPSVQVGVTLAATLTMPKGNGPFPAVVLITGSGPQDRNEELLGHKPFLVLADYLTRQGIAVLRADDRGIAKSTGTFSTATSADFAQDVRGGIAYLKTRKEIDATKIGLIGHSEGGLIAPMVAADSRDVAFIVLMAGPGVPGDEVLNEQQKAIQKSMNVPEKIGILNAALMKPAFTIAKAEPDNAAARTKVVAAWNEYVNGLPDDEKPLAKTVQAEAEKQLPMLLSPWFRYFISYDPRPTLQKVTCPVLALNGSNDLQVIPTQNLPQVEAALKTGGNTHFVMKQLPGLNHLFQHSKTGAPTEYGDIEETIAPEALEVMGKWILSTVKP